MPKKIEISSNDLRSWYVEEKLSTVVIADALGTTKATIRRKLVKAGIPLRSGSEAAALGFESGRRKPLKGEDASNYKGSRRCCGYVMVRDPHARAKSGLVMEHRLIMERHLDRLLRPDEHVHHKNEVRDDNRLENLEVMSRSDHLRKHLTERWMDGRMENACKPRKK